MATTSNVTQYPEFSVDHLRCRISMTRVLCRPLRFGMLTFFVDIRPDRSQLLVSDVAKSLLYSRYIVHLHVVVYGLLTWCTE
jgi:hypothetical protein